MHRPWAALRAKLLAPVEAVGPAQRREAFQKMVAAWTANGERAALLERLTGQDLGQRFADWKAWWTKSHPEAFDWDSGLGPRPQM